MNTGMDINSMVSKIVDAERLPKQRRIDNEQAQNNASISAYGRLRESLDTMKGLMTNFRQNEAFAVRKVNTSDDQIVSASATTDAIAGRYAVDVLQLAQSHKVASAVLDEDMSFGPGKLHISLGNRSFNIDIDQGAELQDVVAGINRAKGNPGVRASIINDVNGPRLIVASDKSGEANRLSIRAETDAQNPLRKLEYKTLEQRVLDLEKARAEAQQLIAPLTPEQQKIAATVADKIANAARLVDQSVAQEAANAASQVQEGSADATLGLTDAAVNVAAQASDAAKEYIRPEDRIPGWTETASGTLLDSYQEADPELDQSAIDKSSQVPGWSNTASGTLYDSYVTPEEAKLALDKQLAREELAVQTALKTGSMTPEEAKAAARSKLTEEERSYLDKVDAVNSKLKLAQGAFDSYLGMSEVQAAQDSKVILDGVAQLSSDNNVIEDAIGGVDLALKGKSEPNKPAAEIDIEYDRDSVRSDIENFVSAYNQFYQVSNGLGSVDPVTGEAGPLAGDSIIRSADARLKRVFSTKIEQASGDITSLTALGVTTTRQGTLEINYDMLNKQLNNNFDKLGDFFGGNKGFAKQVEDAIQSMTGVTGSIRTREKSLTEQNYNLRDDQAELDRRMETIEKRTLDKFSAMQDATSNMQNQLAGMMNALGQ
jgi:flagellar hook-associated protein 2